MARCRLCLLLLTIPAVAAHSTVLCVRGASSVVMQHGGKGAPRTLHLRTPARTASRAPPVRMFGPPGGGFLNMGTPELVVIGAVAWVLLGPKELFRLSREAGAFLGEWQQLGRQAQQTFQDALESELAEEEGAAAGPNSPSSIAAKWREEANEFASKLQPPPPPPPPPPAAPPATVSTSTAPPAVFEDLDEKYARGELDEEAMLKEMQATLGDPETNRQNFQAQLSGERNAQVLAENPAPEGFDLDGSEGELQGAEEDLLAVQIAEAENALAALQAEKDVLALRRKQLEANAERARRRAEDEALAGREGPPA
mmetsp:Transcript_3685/g.12373  ORF Transcript_3685/g.12373 Transcript_3685/m.12373 type:complete len:312 (-) Transcript_3685:196-1131(-)